MHKIILAYAYIACVSYGRRVQYYKGQAHSNEEFSMSQKQTLAVLLRGVASPLGFNPSVSGLRAFTGDPSLVPLLPVALDRQTELQRHIASLSMKDDLATRSATGPRQKLAKLMRTVLGAAQNVTRTAAMGTSTGLALLLSQECALAESGTLAFDALPVLKKMGLVGSIGLAIFVVIRTRQAKKNFQNELDDLEKMLIPDEDVPVATSAKPLSNAPTSKPKLQEDKYDFKVAALESDSATLPEASKAEPKLEEDKYDSKVAAHEPDFAKPLPEAPKVEREVEEDKHDFKVPAFESESVAAPVVAPAVEENSPAPAPAPDARPKKRFRAGMLIKPKKAKKFTVAELTEGHSENPKAAFCMQLQSVLRPSQNITSGAEKRFQVISKVVNGFDYSSEVDYNQKISEWVSSFGITRVETAQAFVDVARALLIEYVDTAAGALYKPADVLEEAVIRLCDFVQNVQVCANILGVKGDLEKVVYEGEVTNRKLERLYTKCLIKVPFDDFYAQWSSMVPFDNFSSDETMQLKHNFMQLNELEESVNDLTIGQQYPILWPLLQIRTDRADSLLLDMAKRKAKHIGRFIEKGSKEQDIEKLSEEPDSERFTLTSGKGKGKGEDSADKKPSKKEMKERMDQLEMMIDSGLMPEDELKKIKKKFSDNFGMPIPEIIQRKDELRRTLAPEGLEQLELVVRLFDPKKPKKKLPPPTPPKPEEPKPPPQPEKPIDESMQFSVKKSKAPVPEDASPAPASEELEVKVRKKTKTDQTPAPSPTPVPAPAAQDAPSNKEEEDEKGKDADE